MCRSGAVMPENRPRVTLLRIAVTRGIPPLNESEPVGVKYRYARALVMLPGSINVKSLISLLSNSTARCATHTLATNSSHALIVLEQIRWVFIGFSARVFFVPRTADD